MELLKDNNMTRTLVFTRTKHGADKVMKNLSAAGYTAAAIHGNKSQNNRERALAGFKAGKILVLVATDIAARGIDVDGVSHVVNYDLPHVPEVYVHRIGRTARAGADGSAIAFCTPEDRGLLRDIEKTIRAQVPVVEHALGLKGVQQLAPTFGWNPAGKDKPGRASRITAARSPTATTVRATASKQGRSRRATPQPRSATPSATAAAPQAPKRTRRRQLDDRARQAPGLSRHASRMRSPPETAGFLFASVTHSRRVTPAKAGAQLWALTSGEKLDPGFRRNDGSGELAQNKIAGACPGDFNSSMTVRSQRRLQRLAAGSASPSPCAVASPGLASARSSSAFLICLASAAASSSAIGMATSASSVSPCGFTSTMPPLTKMRSVAPPSLVDGDDAGLQRGEHGRVAGVDAHLALGSRDA